MIKIMWLRNFIVSYIKMVFINDENFIKAGHSIFKNGKLYPIINGNTKIHYYKRCWKELRCL
jgi:hypothetical protein